MVGVPLPPLVEPGPPLGAAALARHARHLLVAEVGESGQRRLAAARVLVVGAGGLGSPVLLYLAAAGVGTLGIADDDTVATSNLARQIVHGSPDVGRAKVDSAAESVHRLDPSVVVRTHGRLTDPAAAARLVADYDLVVDGTDSFESRYVVADATTAAGVPHVWGSVLRLAGQVSVFWAGHGPVYRDVFPAPPPAGSVPSCAEGGVVAAVCGAVGSVLALEAVKCVCGIGEPLVGRLLTFDGLTGRWREVPLATPAVGRMVRTPAPAPVRVVAPPVPERREVPVEELAERLRARDAGDDPFVLVDVREPDERLINDIPGGVGLPLGEFVAGRAASRLPPGVPVVLYCHRGVRSAHALDLLVAAGVGDVAHVPGGTSAWVHRIDPSQPDY
jgi:molybdopterin/thiamine biosynthesis adenylyltransferase/rhodanese-related sulfurtransferase